VLRAEAHGENPEQLTLEYFAQDLNVLIQENASMTQKGKHSILAATLSAAEGDNTKP
jgi:hypothetical protein